MKIRHLISASIGVALISFAAAQETGIINNANSPHVKFKSINIGDCSWTDGFWGDKYELCESVMVPHMGTILKGDIGHGYNNFKIAAGLMEGEHQGFAWHDGDFFKWMEASTYIYANNKDEKILKDLDEIIALVAEVQEEDGYIHTKSQINGTAHFSNRKHHEMYNYGHLFTAACIHNRVTGQTNFLDIAIKSADLLYDVFMPENPEFVRFGFNQTQIMGLAELYRTVGDKRYLELAEVFINRRGKFRIEDIPSTKGYPIGDMVQERVPLRRETEAVGHAVLALYYYAGAADVYAETGEKSLIDALDRLWDNVVHKKMYVTGALGQSHYGASSRKDKIEEGFIDEYMMPNMTAYNETCANICNSMFSYRMLGIKGESKYADIMELVLFNSGLSGIDLEGTHYYYSNPLRKIHGSRDYSKMNTESPDRLPYLKCFCCPPNLVRTVAKSSAWAYSLTDNGVAVNLFGGNELSTTMLDGSTLKLTQKSQYPWEGSVEITIDQCKESPFSLMLRIPNWAVGSSVKINGEVAEGTIVAGEFATITRSWKAGDRIDLEMPMEVTFVEAHDRIEEARNQVAIKRGPIVYCLESADLPEGVDVMDAYLSSSSNLVARFDPEFLGGVTVISGDLLIRKDEKVGMYRTVKKPEFEQIEANFVPYHAWSNRGDHEMTVFMPIIWE